MASAPVYKVTRVTPAVYLDEKDKPVNGFSLTVDVIEFSETITLNVPTTDPDAAKKLINAYLKDRRALAELSG